MNSKNNELELFTNPNCRYWANAGECEKNPGWILPNCPIECNYNQPNPNCRYWANAGECEKNPGWMLPNCPNECNYTQPTPRAPVNKWWWSHWFTGTRG